MTNGDDSEPGEVPPPAEVADAGLTETELGPGPEAGAGAGPGYEPGGGRHQPGGRRGERVYSLARAGFIEYDRVVFFSDAIFAIAITLLAVELRHPAEALGTPGASLFGHGVGNSLLGFGISFGVIGLFWLGHHGLFRYIVALDRTLILLNLLFLGTIAFLPYPTQILAGNGAVPSVVNFYAISAAVAGLAELAIWVYATARPELTDPAAQSVRLLFTLRIARMPVVFLVSVPVAVAAPQLAQYLWTLVLVLGLLINRLVPAPRPPARTS